MKQLKRKLMMTLVALLAVTTGAWADNAVPYTVGATDNSGLYRSQNSNTLAIKDGQIATFEFTNYTSGEQGYHNWICEIDNAADQDQALIRADLWENVAGNRDNYTFYNYWDMIANNDAATFKAKMQGAKVRLQAIYYQGKITIEATMTPTEGEPLVMVYEKAYTETLAKILLTIERCHLDITKEEIRTIVPLTRGTGDKANQWTMDGGMPAGNVIVNVEYFDFATITGNEVTETADVAAKTETPLVTFEGTITGGTLMYAIGTETTYPDLDGNDWSADIPTAETIDAAGTYYVWYYIKGDDEHSDTDPVLLAVKVLPEPTYDVTFAEGTDPNEWTASPNAGVTKGQTVTVTYTGQRKVMGVKAEKKGGAEPASNDLSTINANYTASDGEILTGTLGANVKISIAAGATVTLDGVSINANGGWTSGEYAGITCEGNATIILSGTNAVKAFDGFYPGIYVPVGSTVTINGSGSLTASGNGGGAGIGGGWDIDCGNIEIQGGTIEATAGNEAAGIGGGTNANCGNITISGGTVTATGGYYAAGIGSGASSEASCGSITISGGTVTATGAKWAAGIGSGAFGSSCGAITITSGVNHVTATKGEEAPNSIGAGDMGSSCGTVSIDDPSKVTQN